LLSVPLLAVLNAGIRGLISGDVDDPDPAEGCAFPPADIPADPDPLIAQSAVAPRTPTSR
jgi:hypothetical protein